MVNFNEKNLDFVINAEEKKFETNTNTTINTNTNTHITTINTTIDILLF